MAPTSCCHKEINIGIAVALDWGLIVPVVKNADEKNFLGIQRTMNDLAERARAKKLKPEEVQESTFSITNPGVFGGLLGLPVINQPNVGILGLGAIEKRPVVINDAIAIRSMGYVTLSYDHRVVDGAIAHQFLHKVKESLENWSVSAGVVNLRSVRETARVFARSYSICALGLRHRVPSKCDSRSRSAWISSILRRSVRSSLTSMIFRARRTRKRRAHSLPRRYACTVSARMPFFLDVPVAHPGNRKRMHCFAW